MSLYSTQRLHTLRMIVTGGGTGGHTYPALTTINALQVRLAETGTAPELLWVGVADGLEAKIANRNNIPFRAITTGKLRRSPNPRELARNVVDAFRIPWASRRPPSPSPGPGRRSFSAPADSSPSRSASPRPCSACHT